MKNVFLLFLVFSLSCSLYSQESKALRADAQKLTTPLVTKYGLSKAQEAQMLKVQERKLKNTEDIQIFKNTDELMYYKKKKSIQEGTDFSIRKLLNKTQMVKYNQDRALVRLKRANTEKILRAKGVTGFDLDKALIDIE
ncbi:MAG TPA: hypothetical protein VK590_03260 [Saprospiraceae bacterium]|nr:hypothetical protein [Saprospiraceae bacterium]